MEVRLQKLIAGTGLASRRKAEELIRSGRVMINGRVVKELGIKVNPDRDHVKVDGKHLRAAQPHVYLILHKPKNVMSTLDDPEGRPTVKDLLHGVTVRVFPVGRLDFDSEGLMLLTNQGSMDDAQAREPKMETLHLPGGPRFGQHIVILVLGPNAQAWGAGVVRGPSGAAKEWAFPRHPVQDVPLWTAGLPQVPASDWPHDRSRIDILSAPNHPTAGGPSGCGPV